MILYKRKANQKKQKAIKISDSVDPMCVAKNKEVKTKSK